MESKLGEVCTHGQLKRQCPLCEIELECAAHKKARLEDEGRNSIKIDELRARIAELEDELRISNGMRDHHKMWVDKLGPMVDRREARLAELVTDLSKRDQWLNEREDRDVVLVTTISNLHDEIKKRDKRIAELESENYYLKARWDAMIERYKDLRRRVACEAGPPLLFETMIFPGNSLAGRYTTWDEAIIGHRRAVELVSRESAILFWIKYYIGQLWHAWRVRRK